MSNSILKNHPGRPSLALIFALLFLAAGCSGSHPGDEGLTDSFEQNRASFERLLELSRQEQRLIRISHDWSADAQGNRFFGPTPGVISVERWGEYRSLFYELEILDGFEVTGDTLYLLNSSAGHGDSRSFKGYAHSNRTLRACSSLDDVEEAGSEGCFRSLGGGWHLFLRKTQR